MGYIQHGLQIVATKRLSLASQRKERQDRRQSLGKHSKISHGLPMFLNGEEFPITVHELSNQYQKLFKQ